ncbi:trypsin 3A1-like [Ochlerotatus camptorhynchus]|uniref:trypsin 3A1-like n=1 Tax=Ochlerotatus camptorhynchus TaxID=644619 RepID=UPI0031E1C0B7
MANHYSLDAHLYRINLVDSNISLSLKVPFKIAGGFNSSIDEHPYLVALESNKNLVCAGSILSPSWILTAAHCLLDKKPVDLTIRAGSSERGDQGTTIPAKEFYIHKWYDVHSSRNDIALVELSQPITRNNSSLTWGEMVNLVEPDSEFLPETICTVSGWGSLTTFGAFPDRLHSVEIPLWSTEKCRQAYWPVDISDDKICAGSPGKDSCRADSGSPLMCKGKQIGLVSWGFRCGDPNYPGVYTNVSYFYDWIHMTSVPARKLVRSEWVHSVSEALAVDKYTHHR